MATTGVVEYNIEDIAVHNFCGVDASNASTAKMANKVLSKEYSNKR